MINKSLNKLLTYVTAQDLKGYDPYDTLLSWIPFSRFGKFGPLLAIQFQKRNPINIRPLMGIKKDYNPKGMGLFLQTFSLLYEKTGKEDYKQQANDIFNWLSENYSKGYTGYCWGYNFPWASHEKYLEPYIPSAVVTGFVTKGLFEYHRVFQNDDAVKLIESASQFIIKDLPSYSDQTGTCISYTPIKIDICYNASLLAGEVLAMEYALNGENELKKQCYNLVSFVISRQKDSGEWYYSEDPKSGVERKQIDFHQGYILESIFEIKNLLQVDEPAWDKAIEKGLKFYHNQQFFRDGRSLWRIPKKYPVEIHNQSQGIITFTKLSRYGAEYSAFARKIAEWTINNMQSRKGYFYYHKNRLMDHKIPYMRWSQAWMLLALTHLLTPEA